MKKFLLLILLSFMFVLSACAGAEDVDQEPTNEDYNELLFSKTGSSYTTYLSSTDIFDGLHNFEKEFFIAYSIADSRSTVISPLETNEEQAYRTFLQKLDTLELHNNSIFSSSSSELKSLIEGKGGTATAEDIFVFNSVKNTLERMAELNLTITRKDYVSLYLETDITNEMYNGILRIQSLVNDLDRHKNVTVEIEDYSYLEFIDLCETELETVFSDTELSNLEDAFGLLDLLYEKGEAD